MAATTKGKPSSPWCIVQRKSLAGQWKQRGREGGGGEGRVKVIHGDACPGILIAALTLIGLHDAL